MVTFRRNENIGKFGEFSLIFPFAWARSTISSAERVKFSVAVNLLRAKLSLWRSFTDEVFEQPSAAINAKKHVNSACFFSTCFL